MTIGHNPLSAIHESSEFFRGMEIGVLYTLMSGKWTSIVGEYFKSNEDIISDLAHQFGYSYESYPVDEDRSHITFVLTTPSETVSEEDE